MGRDRQQRLRSLRQGSAGWLWIAVCTDCGHTGSLPAAQLIQRHGELYPLEFALIKLRCDGCHAVGRVEAKHVRLCQPGCRFVRG